MATSRRLHPIDPRTHIRAPFAALAVALALFASSPARSATPVEALHMAWDDCPLNGGGINFLEFGCDNNLGSSSLYCGFSVLEPIDQIVGLEVVVDVQHSQSTLPEYWRLGPAPDCRHDALTASVDFSATSNCMDPGFTGAVMQDYIVTEPRGLPSQARIKAVVFVPSPETRSVSNDTTYHAVRLVFSYDRTINVGACFGCQPSACLVLNSVLVRRLAGAPGGDVMITTPAPAQNNWAYWRTTTGAMCALVPVRNVTWGAVKSMYR